MSNSEPKTVRELYFFVKGEFETLHEKLDTTKKITFWIGGITGTVFAGLVIGFFKIVKWIK